MPLIHYVIDWTAFRMVIFCRHHKPSKYLEIYLDMRVAVMKEVLIHYHCFLSGVRTLKNGNSWRKSTLLFYYNILKTSKENTWLRDVKKSQSQTGWSLHDDLVKVVSCAVVQIQINPFCRITCLRPPVVQTENWATFSSACYLAFFSEILSKWFGNFSSEISQDKMIISWLIPYLYKMFQ